MICAAALFAFGCTSTPAKVDANLSAVWKEYRELPDARALAVAGNPRGDRFVAGLSGGHASSDEAAKSALRECGERRHRMMMPHACKLYAVGDDVVWSGP